MRIKFLGHGGAHIISNEFSILLDPWLSHGGAFLNSWFQYPDNRFLSSNEDVIKASHIWISHEHPDHYDFNFLESLPKNKTIIIPKFKSPHFRKLIERHNFQEIIEMENFERIQFGPSTFVTMLLEYPLLSEHSSILVETDHVKVFHNADTSLSPENLRHIKTQIGEIDIYFGQYSASSPFPHILDKGYEQVKKYTYEHLEWSMKRFEDACSILMPKYAIPCAGPALVRGLSQPSYKNEMLNDEKGPFAKEHLLNKLQIKLNTEVINLQPDDDLVRNESEFKVSRSDLKTEDLIKLSIQHLNDSLNTPTPSSRTDILKLHEKSFKHISKKFAFILKDLTLNYIVHLSDLNLSLKAVFEKGSIFIDHIEGRYNISQLDGEFYEFSILSKYWQDFLENKYSFDEIHYSQMYKVIQSPNGFSSDLIGILRSLHCPVQQDELLAFKIDKDQESIVVQFENKNYHVKKYCPHLGIELDPSHVNEQGEIRCSAHGWRFCLKTGECTHGDKRKSIAINKEQS